MSSDAELERLLRDAARTLPEPDAASTQRAHTRALVARRRRRPRRRVGLTALVGAAVAIAIGLGVAIGALVAPTGTASQGPVGLGFLPQPGWFALQSRREPSRLYQTFAMAANVPFEREDEVAGLADPSGLPYATLLKLPAGGVVIVAGFTKESRLLALTSPRPVQTFPLRLGGATPYIQYGTQVRPDEPLGQYQLRAAVNGYYVDVTVYFGVPRPSEALLAAAQRQLDQLLVAGELAPSSPQGASVDPSARTAPSQSVTLTFVRFYDVACNCFKARVSGRVSSGRAGEEVVVLHEYCGRDSGRAVAGAITGAGGSWEAVLPIVSRPDAGVAESFRARWNGQLSDPVTFRGRLSLVSGKRRGAGQLVTVVTPSVNPLNLKGRPVVLQRQAGGRWTRVASARLAPHRSRFYTFTAAFTVPRRGWTLRAFVPARAAAPCFTATTSRSWVS